MNDEVHVIAATGRSGQSLVRALQARGIPVIAVIRDVAKWENLRLPGELRVANIENSTALQGALADARRIVSCAHASYAPAILAVTPAAARYIFLGSTWRYTRWPNPLSIGVRRGEEAFLASGRNGVMLHPTMIYGAQGENNVQRLVALLRRLPVIPLPDGGTSLVQPIYQDDVTRCVLAALEIDWHGPHALVIAGPSPTPYAYFVRAVARAARLSKPRIVPVPASILMALAALTPVLPVLPSIKPEEIRRLVEDKAFSIEAMTSVLGVQPVTLDEGLRRMFASLTSPGP